MNNIWRWLGAVWVAWILTACGGGESAPAPTPAPAAKAKTTMMVYLVASNLEDSAVEDLAHMVQAPSSPDVEVIVQIGGGATPGAYPGIDMQKTQRYRLVPAQASQPGNKLVGNGWKLERLPQAQQPAQVAMNVPSTLQDFIQWGAQNYPAEQFHLTLWNHGGGPIHGFGRDDALGGGTTLTVAEITSAIRHAGVHFELVGFDACLMASLEVASALQPYANYLVASEEVTYGWAWNEVVEFMVRNPSATGKELGELIVQTYKDSHPEMEFTAYSATHLQAVPALVRALEKAFSELQQRLDIDGVSAWASIAKARHEAEDFQSSLFMNGASDLVDVLSFAEELVQRGLLSLSTGQAIQAAHAQAVLFYDGGEDEAHGLMMYFPAMSLQHAEMLEKYARLEYSPAILDFVARYAQWVHSGQLPEIAIVSLGLNGQSLQGAVSSNQSSVPSTFDSAYAVLLDGANAVAMQSMHVQGHDIALSDASQWPMLDGELVSLIPENERGDIFLVPVKKEGGDKGMLYAFKDAQGQLSVKFFVVGDAGAGFGLALLAIAPGTEFYPLHMNMTTQKLEPASETIVAPVGDWLVEMETMQGSNYSLRAVAVDVAGRVTLSAQSTLLP